MKSMILIISMFVISAANAQGPVDVCGYGSVSKIATVDEWGGAEMVVLTKAEEAYIAGQVDAQNDCNEGVEITGIEMVKGNVKLVTECSADSLGTKTVKLTLTCEDGFVQ